MHHPYFSSLFPVSNFGISNKPLLRPDTQGTHQVVPPATETTREWKDDRVSHATTPCVAGAPANWLG